MSMSTPIARVGTISATKLGCLTLKDFSARVDWTGARSASSDDMTPWVYIDGGEVQSEMATPAVSQAEVAVADNVSADTVDQPTAELAPVAVNVDIPQAAVEIAPPDTTETQNTIEAQTAEREEEAKRAAEEHAAAVQAAQELEAKQLEAMEQEAKQRAAEEAHLAEQEAETRKQTNEADKAAAEKLAAEKLAAEQESAEHAAAEQAARDKAAAEARAAADDAAARQRAAEGQQAEAAQRAEESQRVAAEQAAATQRVELPPSDASKTIAQPSISAPQQRPMPATTSVRPITTEPPTRVSVAKSHSHNTSGSGGETEYLRELESLVLDLHRDLAQISCGELGGTADHSGWLARRVIDLSIENLRLRNMLAGTTTNQSY